MEEVPLRVSIVVPSNIPELRGRHATTPPHGCMTTFRAPWEVVDEIDRARKLIDPSMSRGLFVRLAAQRVAEAINRHNDSYLKGASDDGSTIDGDVQPPQSD